MMKNNGKVSSYKTPTAQQYIQNILSSSPESSQLHNRINTDQIGQDSFSLLSDNTVIFNTVNNGGMMGGGGSGDIGDVTLSLFNPNINTA